ncbi:hypothetical protein NECAME_12343 [Necator americanus]|uniref:Reverse transcriptase domain-containing protein n=1 Tax=Necator americanus TaxID=51031 RepID=W2T2L4_NECAM|nr:hypothetical protein NECAME_12343 [Necator americanus]ETN75476.1 hypothetical protein NECAME_12343 [Necator americanus]
MEHTKIVEGADGIVLGCSDQILERWREYYNQLCNREFCQPPIPTVPSVECPHLPTTAVEVSAALAKMKSNKATGPDDILTDVWKLLRDRGRTDSSLAVTVPIWKGEGDIAGYTSYKPIRLLCHTMKVFERVLEARLRKIVSVSLNQCGFVKSCSTMDAIHAARILLERNIERRIKAFDCVPHELLKVSMGSHRPEEYQKIIAVDEAALCEAYQRCSNQHPWTLLFADDVMLASESRDDLQKTNSLGRIGCSNINCALMYQKRSTWSSVQGEKMAQFVSMTPN